MGTEPVNLATQIAAVETAIEAFGGTYERNREFFEMYPGVIEGKVEALQAASRTLAWLQAHEQTIRDAISSARALDATPPAR